MGRMIKNYMMIISALIFFTGTSMADQVILDDLIVEGSECVGLDCTDSEGFGYDTLRLKEDNLRIRFEDTSTMPGFPSNDWGILINDSTNGGDDYFGIQDVTDLKTPFKIEAGAPENSLVVEESGRIGIGTGEPLLELHIKDGDTPGIRFEQAGSGWTPQTWDIAGNETNFFVRDVTNGQNLPFKIMPGADTNSLCISANSNIGMGIKDAVASLHIQKIGLAGTDKMLFIKNDEIETLTLDGNGNLTVSGTISHGSSRLIKKELKEVDPDEILENLLQLDIYTWQYKKDEDITHLGPMAEDFGELFNLGADNRHLAPGDMGGVAFAAIKALNAKVEEKDRQIDELKKQNAEFEERLSGLEALLDELMTKH